MQDCSNSIANALGLLQSCTLPSISINSFKPSNGIASINHTLHFGIIKVCIQLLTDGRRGGGGGGGGGGVQYHMDRNTETSIAIVSV